MDKLHSSSPLPDVSVAFFTPISCSRGNCLKAQIYDFHCFSQPLQSHVMDLKLECDRFLPYSLSLHNSLYHLTLYMRK